MGRVTGLLDRQGHVNNAVFATFFETGRVTHILDLLDPGETYLLARIEIDYLDELHYPDTVDIGTRILAIGRTSYRLGGAVFSGERCVATAESVLVLADVACGSNAADAAPSSPGRTTAPGARAMPAKLIRTIWIYLAQTRHLGRHAAELG